VNLTVQQHGRTEPGRSRSSLRRLDDTAPPSSERQDFEIFALRTRVWATGYIAVFSIAMGAVAAQMAEPKRSGILAIAYLPLAIFGTITARHAASRSDGIVRRIWRLYSIAMVFAAAGAAVYATAFGLELREASLLGVPIVVAGVGIFARIYALAVRLFRGSSENLLELVDFVTVAFSTTAVLLYGAARPIVRQGEWSRVHVALLPAFSAVFIFALLYIVASPSRRPRWPEYVFLTAGCLLFAGTIAESATLVIGWSAGEPSWLVTLRSIWLLTGLGLLSAAPLYAVRLGPGSEAEFRGPWQPPRFFLPYWSLLALVILAAAATIEGGRLSVIYAFSAFAGATALVVIRQLLTIRENYTLFRQLADADERRLAFLRELLKGVEEERVRLANSIDAGPVQQLTALMLRAERASTRETSHPQMLIEALIKQLSAALGELRDLTRSLRPRLEQAKGLAEAIEIEAREAFTPGSVELDLDLEDVGGIPPDRELHLFRIAEEAIDNVRMHSGAWKVRIAFRSEPGSGPSKKRVVLEIQDNGKGFVERTLHKLGNRTLARTGIASMRERADMLGADFQLVSTPGAGTLVRVVMEGS
jgi:signal transduction histidine kinase